MQHAMMQCLIPLFVVRCSLMALAVLLSPLYLVDQFTADLWLMTTADNCLVGVPRAALLKSNKINVFPIFKFRPFNE